MAEEKSPDDPGAGGAGVAGTTTGEVVTLALAVILLFAAYAGLFYEGSRPVPVPAPSPITTRVTP